MAGKALRVPVGRANVALDAGLRVGQDPRAPLKTGSVAFQVPDGVKVTKVQWGANSDFGSVVQWSVSR